jgi:hypothetical protein
MRETRRLGLQRLWVSKALVLFIPALGALAVTGRSLAQGPDMPLQFKMIGAFYDPEQDPKKGGVNAFSVNIENKIWIFDIESSHTLQGSALGSSVLKRIYPPIMTFTGPKELTDPLTSPEIQGKPYALTGQLYIKRRLFRLTDVQGPGEEGEADPGSEPESDDRAAPQASN